MNRFEIAVVHQLVFQLTQSLSYPLTFEFDGLSQMQSAKRLLIVEMNRPLPHSMHVYEKNRTPKFPKNIPTPFRPLSPPTLIPKKT